MSSFPIFPVGTIFKPFEKVSGDILKPILTHKGVTVQYPLRLNSMSIDSSAIALKDTTSFPAGEILFSIKKFIRAKINISSNFSLNISPNCKRPSIIKHACLIMCTALGISPTFDIDVKCDTQIHSGFGTSGATMGAVCAAINELYGNPMSHSDLIRYIANNYGEEIDGDQDNLKLVQCIGGSVASGLVKNGIIILAGDATPIATKEYSSYILVGTPKQWHPKDAKELTELEELNLDLFNNHGIRYSREIAYDLIHLGLPQLMNNNLSGICSIIYKHRFMMGSINNCSFIYPEIIKIADNLASLYLDKTCKLLSLSSVGPSFFVLLDNDKTHNDICLEAFESNDLNVFKTSICNSKYIINYE